MHISAHVSNLISNVTTNERILRGSEEVMRTRQEKAKANSRARAAVQVALDKIESAANEKAVVPANALEKERRAVAECRGIVAKTASKVSTDLRSWDLFVEEQGQTIGE